MIVTKTLAFGQTELKFNQESGSFKGYASVWGGVDSYQDTLLKGAFLDTLKEHGIPKMFYMHKHDMPVGKYTLVDEDSKGLWVEGELTPNHSLASDVRAALLHETLDGLSIGGMLRKGDYKDGNNGGRIIHKWSKLIEVSPVVFPADGAARIADVKSAIDGTESLKEIEALLRDAGGFSRADACALVARIKSMGQSDSAPEKKASFAQLLALNAAVATLS